MKRPPGLEHRQREGVALLVVLVFIMLLSVIVVEYAYEAEVEATLGAKRNSSFKAYVTAKSAVAVGLDLLQADLMEQNPNTAGTAGQSKRQTPQSGTKTSQDNGTGQSDNLTEVWATGVPIQELDKSVMQCTISDECGKLNLNAIFRQRTNSTQQQPQSTPEKKKDEQQTTPQVSTSDVQIDAFLEATLRALFESFGLQEDPTDAILDWLDQDSESNPMGAESDFYQLYDPPYACRNGKMASIEELMLIKGITPELFFDCLAGNNDNQQTESQYEKQGSALNDAVALSDLLTVHGDPLGRININTAHPKLLEAMFTALGNTNPSAVEALVQARNEQPFLTIEDLQNRGILSLPQSPQPKTTDGKTPNPGETSGGQGAMATHLDVKSSVFRIWGDGCNTDTMVRVEAFVFRITDEFLAATGQSTQLPRQGTQSQKTTTSSTNSMTGYPAETFRILDWRVIR